MDKKKGFTLIELLVVIAIIALLLSILMPSLNKVKQVARDVVCRSNLKQWSLIWTMYTSDYDSKFPHQIEDIGGWPRGHWIENIRNEWQTELGILKCPSAAKYKFLGDTAWLHGSYTSPYKMDNVNAAGLKEECGYGMNVWAYSKNPATDDPADNDKNGFPFKLTAARFWQNIDVRNASNIPLFMDSMWRGGLPTYSSGVSGGSMTMPAAESDNNDNNWDDKNVSGGIRHFAMPRHSSGSKAGTNVLFMDLSARHVMIKEMWTLKWHRKFNTAEYLTLPKSTIWPGTWMDKYADP
jgi:prepilin-type N-terminal cleavage/methylation domain-containing protein